MRTFFFAAALLASTGCSKKVEPVSVKPTPDGPRATPKVTLQDGIYPRFEGFPALSSDGSKLALALVRLDGARGNENGAVQVISVDTGAVDEVAILTTDESDGDIDEALAEQLSERARRARALLAGTRWRPLSAMTGAAEYGHDETDRTLESAGLTVRYAHPRLTVKRGDAQLLVEEHADWSWTAPDAPDCQGANIPFLDKGWADAGHRVLLLMVRYTGSDACWEPEGRVHVLRVPSG